MLLVCVCVYVYVCMYVCVYVCSARNNSRPSAIFRAYTKFNRPFIGLFGHMANRNIML